MRLNNDAGYSTIEALTALVLIAAAGAILVAFSSLAISSTNKTMNSVRVSARLFTTDELIRQYASRIRIPYWAQKTVPDIGLTSMQIPWLDGECDSFLTITFNDGRLGFTANNPEEDPQNTVFSGSGFSNLSVTTWRSEQGQAIGLDVHYSISGMDYRTLAPFAAIPLIGKKE